MQFETSLPGKTIQCAVLRRDGRIEIRIEGTAQRTYGEPTGAESIAFSSTGLSCLDRNGSVYDLVDDANRWTWQRDDDAPNATCIGCLPSGSLFAYSKEGEAWKRTDDGWFIDHELSEAFSPTSRRNQIAIPRISKRNASIFCLLMLMTSIGLAYRKARLKIDAITTLKSKGLKIQYAHELDEDGNPIANPILPGPAWLRKIVGAEWFVTPVSVTRPSGKIKSTLEEVRFLPSITTIDAGYGVFDLAWIRNCRKLRNLNLHVAKLENLRDLEHATSLEKLSIYSHKDPVHESQEKVILRAIEQLTSLEELDLMSFHFVRDLKFLENHSRLRRLKIDKGAYLDASPLSKLSHLEGLTLRSTSVRPIARLTNLRELNLRLGGEARREDISCLRALTNLKTLTLSGMAGETDAKWLAGLSDLEFVSLEGIELRNQQSLVGLSKLLSLHSANRKCDAEVIQKTPLGLSNFMVGHRLDLSACNVSQLGFLENKRSNYVIRSVNLSGNPINDIRGLMNSITSYTTLNLSNTKIHDLSPIANSGVVELDVANTNVTDLSVLTTTKNLVTLNLSGLPISKLPSQLPSKLWQLDLSGTSITDLSSVPASVGVLNLANTRVSDLSSIQRLENLQTLDLSGTPVSNLEVLRNHRSLRSLRLSNSAVVDLSPLKNMQKLKSLELADTNVADLTVLPSLPGLSHVDLSRTRVDRSELEHLAAVHSLDSVSIAGLPVENIAMLDGKPLRYVDLSDTDVKDLGPLNASRLRTLSLANTEIGFEQVMTLELKNTLRELNLSGCPITVIQPDWIAQLEKLGTLRINCAMLNDLSSLGQTSIETLTLENVNANHDFSWLSGSRTRRLSLAGKPFALGKIHAGLEQTIYLGEIEFPAGSVIDFDRFPLFMTVKRRFAPAK